MFNYNMTEEAIRKGTTSLAKRNSSWNADAHKLLVSILVQWHSGKSPQKPVALATAFVKEASEYRAQAISNWFEVHAGFTWQKGGFVYDKTTITEEQVKAAKAEPFWKLTPAAEPKPVSLTKLLQQVINKADKHVKDPVAGDEINIEMLQQLKAMVG